MKKLKFILPIFLLGLIASCDTPEQAATYNDEVVTITDQATTIFDASVTEMEDVEEITESTITEYKNKTVAHQEKLAELKTEMEGKDDYYGDASLRDVGIQYIADVNALLDYHIEIANFNYIMLDDMSDETYEEFELSYEEYEELLEKTQDSFISTQKEFAKEHGITLEF
jgi:hypothetical protein